ncbi:MAG TPA: type I phosphomannose isomerase catalytic subunit [Candidatus Limnocylindrales bacterium]
MSEYGLIAARPALVGRPIRPRPDRRPRPWGGSRLGPATQLGPVGELWLAGPDSLVETAAGVVSLQALSAAEPEALVGSLGRRLMGARFPLLAKLIDTADWLSLQVHPDDATAVRLYGEGSVGKTEAWLVVAAEPGAQLIVGPRPGLGSRELRRAIRAGALDGCCEAIEAMPGTTVFVPAGTLHAIGPGILVYEIQQPSDLTLRVYDWGRPPVPGRVLHVDEALEALAPASRARVAVPEDRPETTLFSTPRFRLDRVLGEGRTVRRPGGASVHVVTPVAGSARLTGDDWEERLGPTETLVVPACTGRYEIEAGPGAIVCIASIPGPEASGDPGPTTGAR